MNGSINCLLSWIVIAISLLFSVSSSLMAAEYDDQRCLDDGIRFSEGYGCWVYHVNGANAGKPVRVGYYYPQNYDWKLVEVQGAGHNANAMQEAGEDAIFSTPDMPPP